MRSSLSGRIILLALAVLAIAALVLLAAGLGSMQFKDPVQYQQQKSEEIGISIAALLEQIASVPMWKHIVFWVGLFLIFLLLATLLPPELRKKLLWAIFRLAIFTLVIIYIVQHRDSFGILKPGSTTLGQGITVPEPDAVAIPDFAPPDLPPMLLYFLSVAVLLVTFGMFWLIGRKYVSMRSRYPSKDSLKDIAVAARQSLDELAAGANWEDSIIRCYARMSDAVSRHRGLNREAAMTPDEFASYLTRSGLPADSVQRLTRLFESVRYGTRSAGDRERDEASACLTDILRYCGEAA